MKRYTDRVVPITGASRPLGRALAFAFAAEGADLVINAREGSADALNAVRRGAEAAGGRVLAVTGDVSSRADVERLAVAAFARFSRVDVPINNASALGPTPMPYLLDGRTVRRCPARPICQPILSFLSGECQARRRAVRHDGSRAARAARLLRSW